jgi:hypothetical protein
MALTFDVGGSSVRETLSTTRGVLDVEALDEAARITPEVSLASTAT